MVRGPFMHASFVFTEMDQAIWLQTLLSEGRNPVDGEIVIPEDVIRRVAAGVTVADPAA
jgi:hypothetical protein